MKRNFIITMALMMAMHTLSYAQADYLPTPPSLNAQAFLQNTVYPVSYHTGTTTVEIPIHTIGLKDISIPVSLIYNTAGIKVEQEASTIGLGWVLNAGGLISKTIMGENDLFEEHTYFTTSSCNGSPHTACNSLTDITGFYGPIEHNFTLSDYLSPSPLWTNFVYDGSFEERFNALSNTVYSDAGGGKEFAPDVFNYSFGPYSGTFIFKRDKSIVKEMEDNVILTPTFEYQDGCIDDISSWEAVTPDGTKYTFSKVEKVEFRPYNTCNDTWHLTSIKTVGGSEIGFEYTKGSTPYKTFNRYQEAGPEGIDQAVKVKHQTYNDCWYLEKITYDGGEMQFNYSNDRSDASWLPRLTSVERNVAGTKTTVWELEQGYFTSNYSSTDIPSLTHLQELLDTDENYDQDWNTKRMRLDAVLMMPADRSESIRYSMTYDEEDLPTKLSGGMDHWGYHNGRHNGTLVGKQHHRITNSDGTEMEEGGDADRNAYEEYADAFILKSITYPTGGQTSFTYESNRYDPANMEGDPHKIDYYYEEEVTVLTEGEGYNNAPAEAVSTKSFSVTTSEPADAVVHYKVDINVPYYNSFFTADMSLTLSLVNLSDGSTVWSKLLKAEELPESWNMTEEKSIFEGFSSITLPAGGYELRITGSLRPVIDSTELSCTTHSDPEDYIASHPYCLGGGLRIKEMDTYTEPGKLESKRTFEYTLDGKTSGKIMSYPRYNTGFETFSSNALRNQGYSVGYSKVTVTDKDRLGQTNGRTEYEFINRPDSNYCYSWESTLVELDAVTGYSIDGNPTGVRALTHPENGSMLSEKIYNSAGSLISSTTNTYEIIAEQKDIIWGISKEYRNLNIANPVYYPLEDIQAMWEDPSLGPAYISGDGIPMGYVYPAVNPTAVRLKSSIAKLHYEFGNALTTRIEHTYDPDYEGFVTSTTTTESNGDIVKTNYTYPFDLATSEMRELTDRNIIAVPVSTAISRNGTTVTEKEREYDLFGNNPVPMLSLSRHRTTSSGSWVTDYQIHSYDALGNPQHITADGLDIVYFWGYEGQHPIAEIRNATLSEVQETLGTDAGIIASVLALPAPGTTAMNALDSLRIQMPLALVTTLTYRPGVGIDTVTDHRGIITRYLYDGLGRLTGTTEKVTSSAPENITSSYSYNYAQ